MLKTWQYLVAMVLGLSCVAMALVLVHTARGNQKLQEQLMAQQQAVQVEVNRGQASRQVGENVLRDIGVSALTNMTMRQLLQRNGYNIVQNLPDLSGTNAVTGGTNAVPAATNAAAPASTTLAPIPAPAAPAPAPAVAPAPVSVTSEPVTIPTNEAPKKP
jgi:hypothetical protein